MANFKLFYFSGTGNTLMNARVIAEELAVHNIDINLENMESIKDSIPAFSSDLIIMFPVYAYGPPKIVKRFIDKLPESAGQKVFLILNYGLLAVNTYTVTSRLLKRRGYEVTYTAGVRMPANYINLYNPAEKNNEKKISKAVIKLRAISQEIINAEKNRVKKGIILLRIPMRIIYWLFINFSNWMATRFYTDDKCNGCGICAKVCPVENISFNTEGKPVWGRNCEQCVKCIHLCPEESIQWFSVTESRRRYKNPQIKIEDLFHS